VKKFPSPEERVKIRIFALRFFRQRIVVHFADAEGAFEIVFPREILKAIFLLTTRSQSDKSMK
jgi:hypothetical protein